MSSYFFEEKDEKEVRYGYYSNISGRVSEAPKRMDCYSAKFVRRTFESKRFPEKTIETSTIVDRWWLRIWLRIVGRNVSSGPLVAYQWRSRLYVLSLEGQK